jgi:hypothetical protein
MINLEGGHVSNAVMRGGVVRERDAARERRPNRIMVVREEPQTAVPIPPEHFFSQHA